MQTPERTFRIYCSFIALVTLLPSWSLTASEQIEVGYRDFSYPEGTGSNSKPTGEKPESKLWFNDGIWWGILWSTPRNAYSIHWLNRSTQDWLDTGTVVDRRSKSRADVGWDGTHLYVASHIFADIGAPVTEASDRGKLYRFSYHARTKTYTRDAGFPVDVTNGKSETLVLAKDTRGQLWVTYVESNRVMVNHSVGGNDRIWATPFALPAANANTLDTDDIASIIAYDGHVGIMWSRQTTDMEGEVIDATMNFAVHDDGAASSAWSSTAIFTSSGDDHINLKAFDGHVYAAIKTADDDIILLTCPTAPSAGRNKADWRHYPVYTPQDWVLGELEFSSEPSRPIMLIDTEKRDLYVFAMIAYEVFAMVEYEQFEFETQAIHYKRTKLDAIRLDPNGPGVPFIWSSTDPLINDPTSTKQNLNSATGLVVLASDEESLHYFHNDLASNPH